MTNEPGLGHRWYCADEWPIPDSVVNHVCLLMSDHDGACRCSCGETRRAPTPAPGTGPETSKVVPTDVRLDLAVIKAQARRKLHAALIASASLLDKPFTDRPELSPWTLSIKPAVAYVDDALDLLLAEVERLTAENARLRAAAQEVVDQVLPPAGSRIRNRHVERLQEALIASAPEGTAGGDTAP